MTWRLIRSMMKAAEKQRAAGERAVCVLLAMVFLSCGSGPALQPEAGEVPFPDVRPAYSLVFIIHGDGDYLYHDALGNQLAADEVTVAKAQAVAETNRRAEVFIFHEQPKKHTLWLFPHRDGEFFYYRNGLLGAHERYWRDGAGTFFGYETEMYKRFHTAEGHDVKKIVFFFGHEIPEFEGRGYDASYADRPFTIDTLAGWLRGLRGEDRPFDLVVLSTCYNGTPYSIAAISPFARYIMASPDNLHLSYFTIHSLGHSDSDMPDESIAAFTKKFARDAFDTLTGTVYTAVSVAVYDVGLVQTYLRSVSTAYERSLSVVKEYPAGSREHCDCAGVPGFIKPEMDRGVEVYYRPPRFGRSKTISTHSGWECWKITDAP